MNDFVIDMRIQGDAQDGEQALNDIRDASRGAGREMRNLGREGRNASTETDRLGRSGRNAARDTDRLRRAERQAAQAARDLAAANDQSARSAQRAGQANRAAAGNMGNLVAQFNDIGVMLASGQNPLTLALQQGTQISQVIGPMGAAGAVRSLGGAFLGMLNPISLVTIGTIAATAALSNWIFKSDDAGDSAMTLEERLEAVSDATERYRDWVELANASTEDLEERFGSTAGAVRSTLQMLERLAASEAQATIDGIAGAMADMASVGGAGDRRTGAAEFFDVNIGLAFTDLQREARDEARQLTGEFVRQRDALAGNNGNLDGQIAALTTLIATTERLADANGDRSADEQAMLKQMSQALLVMYEQRGAVEDAADVAGQAYQQ